MPPQDDSIISDDVLEQATKALRESPEVEMPVDAIARAAAIPGDNSTRRSWRFYLRPLVGCAAVLAIAATVFVFTRLSGRVAFAQVVNNINATHTFTGKIDLALPEGSGMPAGTHFNLDVSVKGSAIRADNAAITIVGDQSSHKMLMLIPLLHKAMTHDLEPQTKVLDIYALMRDYRTGSEKSLGEKTIDGDKVMGFQLVRPAEASGGVAEDWTFWVDPQTKLPVQIEFLGPGFEDPIVLKDLHFDVALEDKLFETKVPKGYALIDTASGNTDPWDQRKYAGQVFDERGKPIEGVIVQASELDDTYRFGSGSTIGEGVKTDANGKFVLDLPQPHGEGISVGLLGNVTRSDGDQNEPIRLEFRHPNFLCGQLEDVNLLPPEQRGNLQVRLRDGKSVTGRVLDGAGKAVVGATVEAVYGRPMFGRPGDLESRIKYSKKFVTDAAGKFELHGLPSEKTIVQVRRTDPALPLLWGQATVKLYVAGKAEPVEIVAGPMEIPAAKVHTLFAMKLVDIDDDLRNRFSLYPFDTVMILDPGPNAERLGLASAQQGDGFWEADNVRITDFNDLARHILTACQAQKKAGWTTFSVHALYGSIAAGDKNGEARMRLTGEDLAELEKLVKE